MTSRSRRARTGLRITALLLSLGCPTLVCGTMSSPASGASGTSTTLLESRLRGALWGFFAGDAIAAPTHWYYGGASQVRADYGEEGGRDYTKPKFNLPGSILNKSNINGGGRGSFSKKNNISIIGDVINHGKRDYWNPTKSIHYHATLAKGENTLEAQLGRVLMKSIVATKGVFDTNHFRKAYMDYMMTPGSHNDTYASTCHRMFFANLVFKKLPPEQCPDDDNHNVSKVDGLVLPTVVALAASVDSDRSKQQVAEVAAQTASVTRRSKELEKVARSWGALVHDAVHEPQTEKDDMMLPLKEAARNFGLRTMPSPNRQDQITACYLSSGLGPILDMIAKYLPFGNTWTGLVANANVGGENVHRGSILGAILGARAGEEALPPQLINGLHDKDELREEIDAFVGAVMKNSKSSCAIKANR